MRGCSASRGPLTEVSAYGRLTALILHSGAGISGTVIITGKQIGNVTKFGHTVIA